MWRALLLLAAVPGCQALFGIKVVGDAGPDAPPRPDAPAGVCGLVGTPCCATGTTCTDGSQCLDVGSGHAQCMVMAGAFQTTTPTTCQPNACQSDDPFATSPCTCPAGFTAQKTTIDSGCGDVNSPTPQLGDVTLCAVAQLPTSSDFGGWWVTGDLPECEMGNACITPNAITSDCTCPSPTQAIAFRVWVPGHLGGACQNGELGGTLGLCLDQTVAVASVRGAFEAAPDGTCQKSSFGTTCKCPPGSLESSIKTITDHYVGPSVSFMQSTITICLAPP